VIVLSVATTGFATMALSLVWLFAFQNLYGYVYQRIGWIIALFMAGLVVGCGWTDRRARRIDDRRRLSAYLWSRLIAVDLLLAMLSFSVPLILPALGAVQTTAASLVFVEWSVSLLVLLTGTLGGAAFALAGGLQLGATGRPGAAAGVVVAADHAGACLGALLTGVLLVPVLGIASTAVILGGMKLVSAGALAGGRKYH
jgi:spermidine synthase